MKAQPRPDIAEVVGKANGQDTWGNDAVLRQRAEANLASELTRELWKYTPIQGFLDALTRQQPGPAARLSGHDQPGVRAERLESLGAEDQARVHDHLLHHPDPARHPFSDLSLLKASGGWLLQVSGTVEAPLEIHYPASGIVPVFVYLDANASVTLIEHGHADGFVTQILQAQLGPGARLQHIRSALNRDVAHYSALCVRVDRDARYQLHQCLLGGTRRRAEVHVVLDGPGAEAELTGAYLVEQGQHLDQQLLVEHRAPHTRSRQKFHGIATGKSKSVFNGRIHIHPHAPKADAELSNKNLALDPQAEMNTKPELEIYTDDVKCAHGATVGQLSLDALFYLTARGIPEAAARRLLAFGFVRECMPGPLAETAAEHFLEALS